jgi:lysozyme family protein
MSSYPPTFLNAVDVVLKNEGGYVYNPRDPGGETNFGISKRSHPHVDIKHLTRDDAIKIYYDEYWLPHNLAMLPPSVATKMFDALVNIGPSEAITCLQRALKACKNQVMENGVIDTATLDCVHQTTPDVLVPALRSEIASYYRVLAAEHQRDQTFVKGWLNRAYE